LETASSTQVSFSDHGPTKLSRTLLNGIFSFGNSIGNFLRYWRYLLNPGTAFTYRDQNISSVRDSQAHTQKLHSGIFPVADDMLNLATRESDPLTNISFPRPPTGEYQGDDFGCRFYRRSRVLTILEKIEQIRNEDDSTPAEAKDNILAG
jgi:hypothetical protein